MTPLPTLYGWEQSAHSLHQAAQLLGAIRILVRDPVPNSLELAMRIEPHGLSTEILPAGGEVLLDFQRAAMVYTPGVSEPVTIPLADHSQASLFETLLVAMAAQGDMLVPRSDERMSYTQALLMALEARGHRFKPQPGELTNDAPLTIDPRVSAEYIEALYRIFTATARFRARLIGSMTPIVVWPEHFDLSFLWFATERVSDEFPHMNFGFAPFDAETERPYLYAYAYPMPDGFERLPLPALAHWHTVGWKGVQVPYDKLVPVDDPEAEIESICEAVYELLSSSLVGSAMSATRR
jgi:hypothetical protein